MQIDAYVFARPRARMVAARVTARPSAARNGPRLESRREGSTPLWVVGSRLVIEADEPTPLLGGRKPPIGIHILLQRIHIPHIGAGYSWGPTRDQDGLLRQQPSPASRSSTRIRRTRSNTLTTSYSPPTLRPAHNNAAPHRPLLRSGYASLTTLHSTDSGIASSDGRNRFYHW